MNSVWRAVWSLFIIALLGVTQAQEKVEPRQEVRQAIQDYLTAVEGVKLGKRLQIRLLQDPELQRIFAQCEFFLLRYPRYPIEVVPVEPLRVNNLFAVCDGKVTRISDDSELKTFFLQHFPGSSNAETRAAGVRAWLRLVQELHQDGFVQFESPAIKGGDLSFEGALKPTEETGKGTLRVIMEFASGKLSKLIFEGNIVPGTRRLR